MEGYGRDHIHGDVLFFIRLGAGDDFADNLFKTAVRVMMAEGQSMEYLENLPIPKFLKLVEEIIEVQEERRKLREQGA